MRGNPKIASAIPEEYQSAVMALYTDEERANVSLPEVTLKLNAIARGELTEAEADGFFWEAFIRERGLSAEEAARVLREAEEHCGKTFSKLEAIRVHHGITQRRQNRKAAGLTAGGAVLAVSE